MKLRLIKPTFNNTGGKLGRIQRIAQAGIERNDYIIKMGNQKIESGVAELESIQSDPEDNDM